jgi:hypothetical protein
MPAKTPELDIRDITGRNKIINGDMRINQRFAGASSTVVDDAYTLDRWKMLKDGAGVTTIQRVTSSVPNGFSHAMRLTVGTADTSIAASDLLGIQQIIEGNNVQDLSFGNTGAKTITLSFWCRSSKVGTYCGSLLNNADNRSYVFEYTINVADTWEYKTVTIAGDITGVWLTNGGVGIKLQFTLTAGSSYYQTANTWGAAAALATVNQVNFLDTVGATFWITGVQLEIGSTATPYEFKTIEKQVEECQRYYEKSFEIDTAPANGPNATSFFTQVGLENIAVNPWVASPNNLGYTVKFKVTKRAAPTLAQYGNNINQWAYNALSTFAAQNGAALWASSVNPTQPSTVGFIVANNQSASSLIGLQGHWTADAELI